MFQFSDSARAVCLLALDVDGVMTDGGVTYDAQGVESKTFNIKDGLGIKLLQRAGIEVAIITGRQSEIVERRGRELGITRLLQGREDKSVALAELCQDKGIDIAQSAYMGDDLPDLGAILEAGIGACPADAVVNIREAADWVGTVPGGHGAVREFAEVLLHARDQWSAMVEEYRQ